MITVKMTSAEYEAYKLYLKSVAILLDSEKKSDSYSSTEKTPRKSEIIDEIKAGMEDIEKGRIAFVDPSDLWESIK